MALYKMLDWGNPFSGSTTPREVVKTKKAWKRFFEKRPADRVYVVPNSAPQFWGDELQLTASRFVYMLIKEGTLEPVEAK